MQHAFDALYFDGYSSRSQAARLYLRLDGWEIRTFGDEFNPPRIVQWPLADIRRNETSSATNTFHFGDFPFQTIECRAVGFPSALHEMYPEAQFLNKGYSWLFAQGWAGIVALGTGLLGLMAAFYFFIMPGIAEWLAGRLPQQYEIEMGEHLSKSILEEMDVDSSLTAALRDFAREVDFQTDYPLQFTVVRSQEANAFAMPGGKIVVFERLLSDLDTPEALTALLAHEAAHVKHRHTLKAMARNLSGYLFVSLLLGDVNGLTTVLLDNANTLNSLSFSRKLEHEADEKALETLAANGLDQHGMVRLFEALKSAAEGRDSDDVARRLAFLSTHPLTDDRIEFAEKTAANQPATRQNPALTAAFERLKKAAISVE